MRTAATWAASWYEDDSCVHSGLSTSWKPVCTSPAWHAPFRETLVDDVSVVSTPDGSGQHTKRRGEPSPA